MPSSCPSASSIIKLDFISIRDSRNRIRNKENKFEWVLSGYTFSGVYILKRLAFVICTRWS